MSHNPASISALFKNSLLGANQGGAPNECKQLFILNSIFDKFNLNI